jgi:hypothetical protein
VPFKEKTAWIALIGIAGAFIAYFGLIAIEPHPDNGRFVGFFLLVTIIQVVITAVASIVVAIMNPADARASSDERDRTIARQAAGGAYYVLLVGVVMAAITYHLGIGTFWMMNAILAAIMIGEATRFALQIRSYRG